MSSLDTLHGRDYIVSMTTVKRNLGQRSVYVTGAQWAAAKELAYQRRMSVSGLIVDLLQKEAKKQKKSGPTGAGKDAG